MKRKVLLTMLCLAISVSIVACGTENTAEQQEVIATEQTAETEIIETTTERVEENTSEQVEQANISEETDTSIDTSDTSTSEANDTAEIMQSKWADINGAWDAVHQFTLYAREQGADYTDGWCWCYDHGKGAGDQPSYAVYMKEGSPDYGKIFHVGEYLPDGSQFCGTNDEWEAFIGEDLKRVYEDAGYEVTEEDGAYVIHID